MPSVGRFLALLEAVSRRDREGIAAVVRSVAEDERKHKHFDAAHRLLGALEVANSEVGWDHVGSLSFAPMPSAAPPIEVLSRVEVDNVEAPVLRPELSRAVRELVKEWQFEAQLRDAGLAPRHTLLTYGPPGCGKTHLARFLAASLRMPLYVVRFDSLVSSYLGETAANLQRVFEFFSSNRCVLLIDEVDAIGKLRDDRNDLGELKRVVISLLQNMDYSRDRSLLVAATNHPHLLDPALWRRFEIAWELDPPTPELRLRIVRDAVGQELSDQTQRAVQAASEGMSGSDLVRIAQSAKRRAFLYPSESCDESLLLSFVDHLQRRQGQTGDTEGQLTVAALALRDAGSQHYSFKELASLTGIAHSTLHHRSRAEGRG